MSFQTEYDGIVVGAGHNGLCLAAYLCKAGLKILVVEANNKVGGFTCTDEAIPGYKINFHAGIVWGYSPVYRDFDLSKYGARFVKPFVEDGVFLRKKRECVMLYDDPKLNFKNLSKYSERDARTISRLYREYIKTCRMEYFSPPVHPSQRGCDLQGDKREEYQKIVSMSPRHALDELFEDEAIKLLFTLRIMEAAAEDYIDGLGDFVLRMCADSQYLLPVGGAYQICAALARIIQDYGGSVITGTMVTKITIKDGTATGIELADGRRFKAKKFVASSAPPPLTFLRLIGEDYLDRNIAIKAKEYKIAEFTGFQFWLALKDYPRYKEEYGPDANKVFSGWIGADNRQELYEIGLEIAAGDINKLFATVNCPTLLDPTYAPPDKHLIWLYTFAPNPESLKNKSYDDIKEDYSNRLIDLWKDYAPNLTNENIISKNIYTHQDWGKHFPAMVGCLDGKHGSYSDGQYYYGRPFPEVNSYRTMIKGLYLCGSSSHPGAQVTFGPGYNATNVIAEDLGIKKWWRPYDAYSIPLVEE